MLVSLTYGHNCKGPASGKSCEEAASEEKCLKACRTLSDPRRDVDAQPATQRRDATQLECCQAAKVLATGQDKRPPNITPKAAIACGQK